jgi:hypothetical protein
MGIEIISNILHDCEITACLLVVTGSLLSPEISNFRKTFLMGNKSSDEIICLMPITAIESTASIV